MLDQAARTIDRLRTMTSTLLDYEAAEIRVDPARYRPFPLSDLLKECVAFYHPYAEQKKVRLLLEGDSRGVTVSGDREKVMEILDTCSTTPSSSPCPGDDSPLGRKRRVRRHLRLRLRRGDPKEKLRKIFDPVEIVAHWMHTPGSLGG